MNTNAIVGVIAGVVVLGGAAYFMSTRDSAESGPAGMEAAQSAQGNKFTGSIEDLAKRGGSWKCDVDTSTGQAVSKGSVYVSGKNVRADFTSDVAGAGSVNSHMIADGEYVYSWSSMVPQGMKVKMTAGEGSGSGATSGQMADANMSYGYDCQPWSADESKFSLPNSVMFMELNL